ncbi:PREDICTED: regulator of G-protein signaling 19-like, partial [Mesitornis unicolor]|uniref:regulator of G-protein signaling 19-like n=1 Tax=Mesitornis unicolor TaxID=54374 RepID=UPI0005280830
MGVHFAAAVQSTGLGQCLAQGSVQVAAGTLAGGAQHGSATGWWGHRAAEEPPEHDPTPSTVYEAGTQMVGGDHRPLADPAPSAFQNEDRERAWRASRETKLETIPNCEACTKPTSEEVRGWAQSFDKLMKSPAGRNVFREFLRTEYSEENMLFWLACEELKTECNKHTIDEKARMIYEDYISILSPKE